MIDVTAALKAAEELHKCIGVLAGLVSKLKTQPDVAAQKLGEALGEVAKTLQAVDAAACDYLSLAIDEGALAKKSKRLLEIEGGSLTAQVRLGLGHCHRIGLIHHTYLDKWFVRTFNRDEYAAVSDVFRLLETADGGLFDVLASVASTLQDEASVVIDLVAKGDEAAARARVFSSLASLRPVRKTMSNTLQTIYALQSDFIDIAAIV